MVLRKLMGLMTGMDTLIAADLRRLNEVQSGLGDKATSYVMSGEPGTVLSSLSNVAGTTVLWAYPKYGETDVTAHRGSHFLDGEDVELTRRYAEVLAAAAGNPLPDRVLGSPDSPPALRVLMTIAAAGAIESQRKWPRKPRAAPVKALTPARLVEAAEHFGGTAENVFDVLYFAGQRYGTDARFYRAIADVESLVRAHPDAVVATLRRLGADSKVTLLQDIASWDLAGDAPFLETILALCGDGAKSVREAAASALRDVNPAVLEPAVIDQLASTKAAIRVGMVELLAMIGSESARAALAEQAKTEKTARVVSAIDNVLAVADAVMADEGEAEGSYLALDGTRVDIPDIQPLETGPVEKLTQADIEAVKDAYAESLAQFKARAGGQIHRGTPPANLIRELTAFLQLEPVKNDPRVKHFAGGVARKTLTSFLARAPQEQALALSFELIYQPRFWLQPVHPQAASATIRSYLDAPNADLRALEALWIARGLVLRMGSWSDSIEVTAGPGSILRTLLDAHHYYSYHPGLIRDAAIWPYLTTQFDLLDTAFGIAPSDGLKLDRLAALHCLSQMPKPPMRYFGALLDAATGERKQGRAEARKMLADAPGLLDRLVALLSDSRQAQRAGAAEWMGARGDEAAVKPLKARLKKEKSELAKAAILTALNRLGADTADFVGPAALLKEAEAGLKKAKPEKLDWLDLGTMPKLRYAKGKPVPAEVITWWLQLAIKLKQPGGNTLFEIYLDQLDPESAETLSCWICDSWIAFDTTRPSDAEANAYAEAHVERTHQNLVKYWSKDATRDQAYAQLFNGIKAQYRNSGTASKGVLGLTTRVPAQQLADRARAYLKAHGSRTSQSSALLEVLSAKGDPVSLQVVIATATRHRQKGVQAFAGELVNAIAERKNWTMDELADRVVPSAGFDEDGHLDLPIGPDEKPYGARLGDDLTVIVHNPDGAVIKGLPSGDDDQTKASKKQLSASKKELKQVVTMQSSRLYEALCAGRTWPVLDWRRDFQTHPVMRRLIERVVWEGLDADGAPIAAFRPTAEGELTDAEDMPVDLNGIAALRIAHGATMSTEAAAQWQQHLEDYEVKPLFIQFGRGMKTLPEGSEGQLTIEDRKGWAMENFKLRGVATKLGYERGPAEDGGWFSTYRKPFRSAGVTAVIDFTGSVLPEENNPVALIALRFETEAKPVAHPVKLEDVPPVLLSECWNDLHAIGEKGQHDPQWEKNCAW